MHRSLRSHGARCWATATYGTQGVERALGGLLFYENEQHGQLAQLICETVPCCDLVRFTGSGTEATMHCLRLARAFTGKSRILKLEGNFHGYHDQVMFAIGTPSDKLGPETAPTPYAGSTGLPAGLEQNLVLVPYNRPDHLEEAFRKHASELAAVICEPIYFNAGCILPTKEFLATLRLTCTGVLLIFDEVLRLPQRRAELKNIWARRPTCARSARRSAGLSAPRVRRTPDIMEPDADRRLPAQRHLQQPRGCRCRIGRHQGVSRTRLLRPHPRRRRKLFPGLQAIFTKHGVTAACRGWGTLASTGVEQEVRSYRDAIKHQREQMLPSSAIENGVYFHDYGGAPVPPRLLRAMTLADVQTSWNDSTPP